jgi:trk system potassium uptake protein
MTAKRRIAVIGLNTFGHALMHSLTEHGLDCLGLDISRDVVQVMASEFPSVLEVDATYEDALIEAGVREYDLAVVTLGTDIASSVLATLAVKNVGVPQVAAKARDNQHAEVLRKVGADIIIFPERDSADRLAQVMLFIGLKDVRSITAGFSLAKAAPLADMVGVPLRQSVLRSRFKLNLVLIKHADGTKSVPDADYIPKADDLLYLVGWDKSLGEYSNALAAKKGRGHG